jgi:hypothetical protein
MRIPVDLLYLLNGILADVPAQYALIIDVRERCVNNGLGLYILSGWFHRGLAVGR